jgi:hypothetical protein
MAKSRRQIGQGTQHKGVLRDVITGHSHRSLRHDQVAVKQQIQIKGPGRKGPGAPHATRQFVQLLQDCHHRDRRQLADKGEHTVQKCIPAEAHSSCFIDGGYAQAAETPGQFPGRQLQIFLGLYVAAGADVNIDRRGAHQRLPRSI